MGSESETGPLLRLDPLADRSRDIGEKSTAEPQASCCTWCLRLCGCCSGCCCLIVLVLIINFMFPGEGWLGQCPVGTPPVADILGTSPGAKWGVFSITEIRMGSRAAAANFVQVDVNPSDLVYKIPSQWNKGLTVSNGRVSLDLHITVPFSENSTIEVKVYAPGLFGSSEQVRLRFQVDTLGRLRSTYQLGGSSDASFLHGKSMEDKLNSVHFRSKQSILLPDSFMWHSMLSMLKSHDLLGASLKFGFWSPTSGFARLMILGGGHSTWGYPTFLGAYEALGYGTATCDNGNLGTLAESIEILSAKYAKTYLHGYGDGIRTWNILRGQELSPVAMQYGWWPHAINHAIGLGLTPMDHGIVRPWHAKMWGANLKHVATHKLIKAITTDYFAKRTSIDTADAKWLVQIILHKIGLDIDLSVEKAKTIPSIQSSVVQEYTSNDAPKAAFASVRDRNLEWKEEMMKDFKEALSQKYGRLYTSLPHYDQNIVAAAAIDALVWAGGLSLGSILVNCMNVLYSAYGQGQIGTDFKFTKENVHQFVFETTRSLPPVGGFGGWEAKSNTHVWIDVAKVSLDKSIWGQHPAEFKLHPLDVYEKHTVNWANGALHDDDNASPYSFMCPGYRLSLMIMTEFLLAFQESGGSACWQPNSTEKAVFGNGFLPGTFVMENKC